MGRSFGPLFEFDRRRGDHRAGRRNRKRRLARAAALALVACLGPGAAEAQTFAQRIAGGAVPTKSSQPQQSLLRSNSLMFDRKRNTVTAVGDVQVYYQGRVLQADRVIYDRDHNTVFAEGHAKLTEPDGSVAYGDRFELTQDFKSGFIDAIRADTAAQTHFTAARAERAGGETTILERAAYTACEPCKEHPERPPLWRLQASKITHNSAEHTLYYQDAELEFYGVPLLYLPYFSTPDPDVRRKSGFLAPTYAYKSQLGFGLSVPYFFNLAPNYDLTLAPTLYTRQGLMLSGEWRHRLLNGSYDVRASGIFEADPDAFNAPPYGANNLTFRGSLNSNGQLYLNQNWKYGWDVALATDKFYPRDYGSTGETLTSNFFGFNTSTMYLTGQGAQSYFDLRGYFFQSLSPSILQKQEPVVAPALNYDRTFELDPKDTHGIGGQAQLQASVTHLDQSLANYMSTGVEHLDQAFSLYDVCPTYARGSCILRGIAGDYTNAEVTASWRRKFIDPIGEVWTPFAFAHLSGTNLNLNTTNSVTFASANGASTVPNSAQPGLLGLQNETAAGEAIPGAGVEWRYPFIARTGWATQIFEPIAQIVVRPSENATMARINEDSQSLVFDDTNLFEWNRFSGADRFEGGTRANYGAQYSLMFNNGGYANLLVGQSYQIAGQNSYVLDDALAVGLGSGLNQKASDYVVRLQYSPSSHFTFIAKDLLNTSNFASDRLDLMGNVNFEKFQAGLEYARYVAQPQIGYYVTREGLSPTIKFNVTKDIFLDGDVVFDLSRHLYNAQFGAHAPEFSIAGVGVGAGWSNDCATFALNYTSVYEANLLGPASRNQTIALSLQLRTLGDTRISSGLAEVKVEDGLQDVR